MRHYLIWRLMRPHPSQYRTREEFRLYYTLWKFNKPRRQRNA